MNRSHILVAEDDKNIRIGLADMLEGEGYRVETANNGKAALSLIRKKNFDLLILDIMMPGKSGYDVCREVRTRNQSIPIIMLTAKTEEIDKVVGLKLGADDYVTKPFGLKELLARIEAVLRRCMAGKEKVKRKQGSKRPHRFSFGPVEVDTREYCINSGKKKNPVTERELNLLLFFNDRPNEVVSRDELLDRVWGLEYYGTTRTLDQHIAKLRKKLTGQSKKHSCIETVHGVGYRYRKINGRHNEA
ncbi:MAG: response regulator transcription factor [Verrucomicrobiota bacterium]